MTHLTSVGSGSFVALVDMLTVSRVESELKASRCYFTKNWDSCRDMWCSYARQNAVTLGNNTNNRLESSWKQMKEVVNSSMGLDECLASIMFYQTRVEQQFYDQATKVSVVHHQGYDREMCLVANLVSKHVCSLIHEQYLYATGPALYTYYEAFPGMIFIKNAALNEDSLDEPNVEYTFREANHITTSISDVVSGLGMHEYRVAMKALARVALLFKEKQFGVIEELSSPRSRGDIPEDAVESDDVIELGTTDSTLADGIGLNEAEGTEVIDVELPLPGTMSSESDTLLGTPSVQSGTPSIQSGTLPSQSGTQSGTVLSPEPLDTATADFEISSPLRPRGRPKQKSKAKKAKRNLSIQIADDDSILHDKRLSLAIIPDILSHESNDTARAENLMQFKLFVFERKIKPLIAHVIAKLPASKPLREPSDISRISARDLLRRSDAKVTSLQKKRNGLAEKDMAVGFPGLGVITTSTLGIMERWHKAVGALKVIDKAQTWVASIDLSMDVPPAYQVDEDAELPAKLNAIPILSEKMDLLDFAAKFHLGGRTMMEVMTKMFGLREDVVMIDPGNWGIVVGGMTTIPDEMVTNMFVGVSNERILIPMNCNGNHWCAIMVNLQTHEIRHYDPMMSSYGVSIRAVAQRLLQFMPRSEGRYKVDPYVTDMGVQVDSYNCGIYVLLAFEMFCGEKDVGLLRPTILQYMRYRYMRMCL
ncbi:unnamed protein product [Phytophthora fragariaefolia]|uniref:Unnamed protein product n=1 Tax=Phytophthora fragariaefolia TaxID=1490495 RepID=A0A9W6YE42_9STRA|nr:unnamed protein product [Phytophthora fragariaefolia]